MKRQSTIVFLFLVATMLRSVGSVKPDPPIPCESSEDCVSIGLDRLRSVSCKNGFCLCKIDEEIRNCSNTDIVHHSNRSAAGTIYYPCKVDHDCQTVHSFCNTTMSMCDCKKGYVLSSSRKSCLEKAATLDYPCLENKQCSAFLSSLICQDGLCSCPPGHHYTSNTCYETIDIGKPCKHNEQCNHVMEAECNRDGVCNCPEETVISQDETRCLPAARDILVDCLEDVQCFSTFQKAICVNGTCKCQDGYHFEPGLSSCLFNRGFGETCGNTYDCYEPKQETNATKSLKCLENVCTCKENYVRENERCVNNGSSSASSFLIIFFLCSFHLLISDRSFAVRTEG